MDVTTACVIWLAHRCTPRGRRPVAPAPRVAADAAFNAAVDDALSLFAEPLPRRQPKPPTIGAPDRERVELTAAERAAIDDMEIEWWAAYRADTGI